jgi:hypothetical protein
MAIGVVTSGCGGSSGGASRTGAAAQSGVPHARALAVAFATCVRAHGVSDYPDPQVSGSGNRGQSKISPGSANVSSPAFRSASHVCHHLLPFGGAQAGGNGAQQQAQEVRYADCMGSHAVPAFPDPDRDGVFTLPATVDEQAPAFVRATHACQNVEPSSLSIDQSL